MTRDELEAELARMHSDAFAWALRCVWGERDEAEDVLQTAYERILDGRARFDQRSSLRTWLFGVVRRTALEQRRRSWLRLALLRRWFNREEIARPTTDDPDVPLLESERTTRLERALARLSNRQRAVLHLVFYQDLSVAEAASVLGLPVGTARTHYERGKTRLRVLLGTEG